MTDCAPAELILAGALRAVARRDRDETSARVALSGTPSACSAAGGSSVATGASFAVSLAWSASAGAASVNAFHAPSGLGLRGRIERSAGGVQRNVARDPSTRFTPVIRRSS